MRISAGPAGGSHMWLFQVPYRLAERFIFNTIPRKLLACMVPILLLLLVLDGCLLQVIGACRAAAGTPAADRNSSVVSVCSVCSVSLICAFVGLRDHARLWDYCGIFAAFMCRCTSR